MKRGVAAAAQGRHDAEAALQAAQEELAAMKLEQQLAATAPAAPAPAMSPAGCATPAAMLWARHPLCACAPWCCRVIPGELWACRPPVSAVWMLYAMGWGSASVAAPDRMPVTWCSSCCRRMDSVLKDNDRLRSEICELQTRLENGASVMQCLQSSREEAEW